MFAGLPSFNSMDAVQRWALELILKEGASASPRGQGTLEVLATGFTLRDPRRRCITNQERGWSLPLAIGEFAWHVSGSDNLSSLSYYAPRWRDFSEDSRTIRGSCYGHRVFVSPPGNLSQWEMLKGILHKDPMSRRAVLNFQQEPAEALRPESIDTSCATVLQFFLRHGRVHAVTYMRSNDVVWGLPYDVFLFTMLQELLTCELGLELGTYSHVAGSLHLYERHLDLSRRILQSIDPPAFAMPPMTDLSGLHSFLTQESALRAGRLSSSSSPPSGFWSELGEVLRAFQGLRSGEDLIGISLSTPYDEVLKPLLRKTARSR